MSSGKIDRNAVVQGLQRMGAPQTVPVEKLQEVAQVAVQEAEAQNLFGTRPKVLDVKRGEGKAVSTTASVSRLWGQAGFDSQKAPLSAMALKNNLTPEQAKAKYAQLEKQQAEREVRIAGRADELDKRWGYMLLKARTEALKSYLADSPNLPDDVKAELEAAIQKSEGVQKELDGLREEVKALKKGPGMKKAGTPEERHALAVKLWAAREAHQKAVDGATEAIDKAGLRIERLTLTEEAIDPTGGAKSQYGSMNALVGDYVQCAFQMKTIEMLYFGPLAELVKDLERERAEQVKRDAIEDAWRERDILMADIMKQLDQKRVLDEKRRVERGVNAVKTRDFGKMSAADAVKLHREKK